MHCILSLLKHVSRKNEEGRRVEAEDPAPKSTPDHPLERKRGRGRETGIRQEVPRVGSGVGSSPLKAGPDAGFFSRTGGERLSEVCRPLVGKFLTEITKTFMEAG